MALISCAADFPRLIMFDIQHRCWASDNRTCVRVGRALGVDAADAVAALAARIGLAPSDLVVLGVEPTPEIHGSANVQGLHRAQ